MENKSIYCGDCLEILKKFPDKSVDMIYADPPFFSNRHYEIIWKDGAEIRAFGDRWKGGVNHYVSWMAERLEQCHRVLKDSGSMYLHCDWHASHYLKIAMDRIFGIGNFRNEIIWKRSYAHNDPKRYGAIHDTILFYTKSNKWVWNTMKIPYEKDYIETNYRYEDKCGKYQTVTLTASKPGGDVEYKFRGVKPPKGRYWAYSKTNIEKLEKEGRIVWSKNKVPRLKIYLHDKKSGMPIQDLWVDIKRISTHSNERLGYPTQKPLALMERIVSVSSNKDQIVLDPFCGCGTTLVASHKLERKYIGIDVSRTACKLMERRLRSIGASPITIYGELTEKQLKKYPPFEFQNWVCEKLGGRIHHRKTGDMGIDGWTLDMTPIQVKQSERVGRNPMDNFQTAIRRANKKKGMFVAFSFGKGAYEEVARAKNDKIEIELITVEELLKKK